MSKLLTLIILSLAFIASLAIENQYYVTSTADITTENGFPGLFAKASYRGTEKSYIKPKSTFAKTLNVTFSYDSDQEFTIHITRGEKAPRYFMPYEFPYSYTKTKPEDVATPDYEVEIIEDPFSIIVTRKSTGDIIFDTSGFDFIYSEFYVEFGTKLSSRYLYGFGERRKSFLYKSGVYTIWNKDNYGQMDEGRGGQQTYGSHPVGLFREASGKWHVMFFRTTNALDLIFDAEKETLKFKVTGGEIELKFFLGDEYPDTAIKQFHNYINGWALTPFWSHGYHQCKWGYIYVADAVTVVDRMLSNDLPIDVIWSDIDYMVNFIDFTIDEQRYPLNVLKSLTDRIRWIPILDSGVFLDYNAPAYMKGTEYDVWIRSANDHDKYLVGIVWPGVVHWPDWLHPNATKYWSEMLNLLYSQGKFSGIWIDMNENTNFCLGESPNKCWTLANYLPNYKPSEKPNPVLGNETVPAEKDPITDKYEFIKFVSEDLPYIPGNMPLENAALSLNALHYGKVLSFDFHNLDPFFEAMLTHQALINITEERPFILTRGTFSGSGQFAAHWTGDNIANWEHLRDSIPELFDFQLFGIPMVGVDICGFGSDTNEELCARWMQLGAFYPFMRNHNALGNIEQEPYALGPTVLETSRVSLKFRYSILKFYYSIFVKNNGAGSVFRPLFFDFPDDVFLLSLDSSFLIGSELLVPSVLQPGLTKTNAYFPGGVRWYDFSNGKLMSEKNAGPSSMFVDAPLNATLPVFIKGGSIVHTQDIQGVTRTNDLSSVFNLVVALEPINNDTSVAFGQMMGIIDYQDDPSVDKCLGAFDCLINVAAIAVTGSDGKVSASVSFSLNTPESTLEQISISQITFYGVRTEICGAQDSFCNWGDVVIKCAYKAPKLIKLDTVSFTLDKETCTF